MEKWIRLAYSMKMRIAMVMVDADPAKTSVIGDLISKNEMLAGAADNFEFPFFNTPGNENPKFRILKRYGGSQNLFFFANENVVNILKPTNDPRLEAYFTPGPEAAGEIFGFPTNGEGDETSALLNINTIYRPDAPTLIFSYQEALFFQAEAYTRGLGVTKDLNKANTLFKSAVKEAMLYYGVSSTVADEYIAANLPDLTTAANPNTPRNVRYFDKMWFDK